MKKFDELINAARERLAERIETIKGDKHNFYTPEDLETAKAERLVMEAQANVLELASASADKVSAAASAKLDEMYAWGSIHHDHLDCLQAALVVSATAGLDAQRGLEALQNAIRSGAGLSELIRLVGPTPQELDLAKARVAQMEALADKCSWGQHPDAAARRARDSWQRIANIQTEYENRYC